MTPLYEPFLPLAGAREEVKADASGSLAMACFVRSEEGHPIGGLYLESDPGAFTSRILLDLMVPDMGGFEFLVALQRRPEWADIPRVGRSLLESLI
ncbi:MAG: hypothetical protein HGA66_11080 [Holophaga sp.]|nr:hypothetical protein [Holophaga sp.]